MIEEEEFTIVTALQKLDYYLSGGVWFVIKTDQSSSALIWSTECKQENTAMDAENIWVQLYDSVLVQ